MRTIDRYLTWRVATRFGLVAFCLSAIFAGYTMAIYLSRASAGFIHSEYVTTFVIMKTIIATEIVLPVSLFVSVILAVEGLRRTEETTAMQAIGYGQRQALQGFLPLFGVLAILVTALSVWVRPWTYAAMDRTKAKAEAVFDLVDLEAGRFYVDDDGDRVVYVDRRLDDGALGGVFLWARRPGAEHLVRAQMLRPSRRDGGGIVSVETDGLRIWRIDQQGVNQLGSAEVLEVDTDFGKIAPLGYRRKAASTADLADSDDPEDIAEFQWRLSRGVNAFLLGVAGLLVAGFARPLGKRNAMWPIAIVVCLGYFLTSLTARSLVRHGAVGAFPGLFWVDVEFAFILFAVLAWGRGRRARA